MQSSLARSTSQPSPCLRQWSAGSPFLSTATSPSPNWAAITLYHTWSGGKTDNVYVIPRSLPKRMFVEAMLLLHWWSITPCRRVEATMNVLRWMGRGDKTHWDEGNKSSPVHGPIFKSSVSFTYQLYNPILFSISVCSPYNHHINNMAGHLKVIRGILLYSEADK